MSWDEKTFIRSSSSKYDESMIENFEMNGGWKDAEAQESKDKMSYNDSISNWNGAFCAVVAILIILLNVCLWLYFEYQDSIN